MKFDRLIESILQPKVIEESINDKNLFKAVILAGGAGSGKSFINELTFAGKGVAVVATDELFELGSIYNQLYNSPELKYDIKAIRAAKKQIKNKTLKIDPESYFTDQMQKFRQTIVKTVTSHRAAHWLNGMLPIVIDGTGKHIDKVTGQKKFLESIGYDVSMLYVDTGLDVAQERNQQRARTLDPKEIEIMWNTSQKTIKVYKKLFKSDFHLVNNSKTWTPSPEFESFKADLGKIGTKLINSPLKNSIGQFVIEYLKLTKGKYYSDINPDFVAGTKNTFKA